MKVKGVSGFLKKGVRALNSAKASSGVPALFFTASPVKEKGEKTSAVACQLALLELASWQLALLALASWPRGPMDKASAYAKSGHLESNQRPSGSCTHLQPDALPTELWPA